MRPPPRAPPRAPQFVVAGLHQAIRNAGPSFSNSLPVCSTTDMADWAIVGPAYVATASDITTIAGHTFSPTDDVIAFDCTACITGASFAIRPSPACSAVDASIVATDSSGHGNKQLHPFHSSCCGRCYHRQ
jgi:hypothetical protein